MEVDTASTVPSEQGPSSNVAVAPGDTSATIVATAVEPETLSDVDAEEIWVHLLYSWQGKAFELHVAESDRVYDLKVMLFSQTNVPPERQKILGLVKGKLPPEDARIGDLKLVNGKKFSLVGTPEGHEFKDPSQLDWLPDVANDLDVEFSADSKAAEAYKRDLRNARKVKEATEAIKDHVNLMHPLREGKKLLVLDLDYTILDTKPLTSGSLPPSECARPGLHEFLEAVYPHYDIAIWSQTSWMWLETKLVELGMVGQGRPYEISFVLDKKPMFTVFSADRKEKDGKPFAHHVKALQIIWNLFPQYNARNTLHVDDLSRNFVLNMGNGIKIPPFKDVATSPTARADRELKLLTRYLLHAASAEDVSALNNKDWRKISKQLGGGS
ncbi:HAD subfamily IIID h [Peniophora sp. CONT]|nr:HAD subfamily IIID h [Peniophora sp. CONT]